MSIFTFGRKGEVSSGVSFQFFISYRIFYIVLCLACCLRSLTESKSKGGCTACSLKRFIQIVIIRRLLFTILFAKIDVLKNYYKRIECLLIKN